MKVWSSYNHAMDVGIRRANSDLSKLSSAETVLTDQVGWGCLTTNVFRTVGSLQLLRVWKRLESYRTILSGGATT